MGGQAFNLNERQPGPFSDYLSPTAVKTPQLNPNTAPTKTGGAFFLASKFLEGASNARAQSFAKKEQARQQQVDGFKDWANSVMNNPDITPEAKTKFSQQAHDILFSQVGQDLKSAKDKSHPVLGAAKSIFEGLTGGKYTSTKPDPDAIQQFMASNADITTKPEYNRNTYIAQATDTFQKVADDLTKQNNGQPPSLEALQRHPEVQKAMNLVNRYAKDPSHAKEILATNFGGYQPEPAPGSDQAFLQDLYGQAPPSPRQGQSATPPAVRTGSPEAADTSSPPAPRASLAASPDDDERDANLNRLRIGMSAKLHLSKADPEPVTIKTKDGAKDGTAIYANLGKHGSGWFDPVTFKKIDGEVTKRASGGGIYERQMQDRVKGILDSRGLDATPENEADARNEIASADAQYQINRPKLQTAPRFEKGMQGDQGQPVTLAVDKITGKPISTVGNQAVRTSFRSVTDDQGITGPVQVPTYQGSGGGVPPAPRSTGNQQQTNPVSATAGAPTSPRAAQSAPPQPRNANPGTREFQGIPLGNKISAKEKDAFSSYDTALSQVDQLEKLLNSPGPDGKPLNASAGTFAQIWQKVKNSVKSGEYSSGITPGGVYDDLIPLMQILNVNVTSAIQKGGSRTIKWAEEIQKHIPKTTDSFPAMQAKIKNLRNNLQKAQESLGNVEPATKSIPTLVPRAPTGSATPPDARSLKPPKPGTVADRSIQEKYYDAAQQNPDRARKMILADGWKF